MIVDTTAIADRAKVKPDTVHHWRIRDIGFPEPLATLAIGPIWEWEAVATWLRESGRI